MAEETSPNKLAAESQLPKETVVAPGPSPATAEALKKAPEAVKRSMPMALSITLGILLAGLLGWLAHYLVWFVLVLYLSFVAATIMDAPVQWLKRLGMRRGMGAVVVMLGTLAVVGGLLYFLANGVYGQVASVSENLGKAPQRIDAFVNHMKQHFPAMQNTGDFDVSAEIGKAMPTLSTLMGNAMWGVETVSWLVIMFFVVLYMLVDGADHLKVLRSILPKRSRLEATHLFNEIAKAHRGWALASLANVLSASLLEGTGLYFLGIPGAYVLGFIAGLGELIPNIGPVLGAATAILFTLLAEPDKFWWVVGMFVVVQTIQSYTISPQMMKFSIELPVLVTIISVLVFGILFGLLGVLVAIPLVADMVVVWGYINKHLEQDTTEYDVVNAAPSGVRAPMSPDNTPPSRLRKLFRRGQAEGAAGNRAAPPAAVWKGGMDKLQDAEKRTNGGNGV